MRLNQEAVEHVAKLARLKLSKSELDKMAAALSDVLAHMESLGAPDAAEARLDEQRGRGLAALRDDVAAAWPDPAGLVALGPDTRNGQYVVPRIVDVP